MHRVLQCALTIIICMTLTACQQGKPEPKKFSVSGTVTLDGEPLSEKGMIYFKTISTGSINAFEIQSGKFTGQAEPGERRVEIVAYRIKMVDLDGMKGEAKESLIPVKYNLESTLTAKVTPEGPNEFKFELTSK